MDRFILQVTKGAFCFTPTNQVKLMQFEPSIHLALYNKPHKQFSPRWGEPSPNYSLAILRMGINPPGPDK